MSKNQLEVLMSKLKPMCATEVPEYLSSPLTADTPFPYSPPSQNPGADSHTELVGPADTDEPETVMVGEPQATGGSGPTESWIG
jgi:hypothetical protein